MSNIKIWTPKEELFLIDNYSIKGKGYCCKNLDRTEASIRQKVFRMNLSLDSNSDFFKERFSRQREKLIIDKQSEFFKEWQLRAAQTKIGKKRPDHSEWMKNNRTWIPWADTDEKKKALSERWKQWIKENGHPRGMKGKKHSDKLKDKMSIIKKKEWANPKSKFRSEEYKQRQSDNMVKLNIILKKSSNAYSRCKKGWFEIDGRKIFFRSSWEVLYAKYLSFQKKEGFIKEWEYEADIFWFEEIRRGIRSYTPDFKVINLDDTIEYHEVKGWMDAKSKTKIKRMSLYYPTVKLLVIDEIAFKEIKKWERLF